MNKIPVGDTISRTYGFAFSNFLSIFGIAWLPYVVLAAIAVGLVFLVAPTLPQSLMQGQFDMVELMHAARIWSLLGIFLFIVNCMVTVGIQRKALGKHHGPVFVYFSLGAPVWRMVGAFFLAGLVIFFVGILTAVAAVAIWFAAKSFVPDHNILIGVLVGIIAVCWIIYLSVRLSFFIPAVVVAEEKISLGRGWELAGGNFWRIVIVAIVVFLPVAIGFGIISSALFGSMFVMPHFHDGMPPQEMFHEMMRDILRQGFALGPVAIVVQIIERIIFLGLGNGMIADAYLGVTGKLAAPAVAP